MKKIIALLAMIAGLATAGTLTFDTINADTAGTVTGTQSNALVSVQSQATANSETGVTHTASIAANVIDIAALEAAALTNEVDILAEYLEQYGTTDITITPTNAFTFDGAGTITAYSGSYTNIVIPYEINGIAVTAIGDNFAENDANIITIVGSKNLVTIADFFASYCDDLTTITLPSATTIADFFASYCDDLTTITLPSATTIADEFAVDCGALTTITLPSATTIGDVFAYDCAALTTITLPSVITIGSYFAYSCGNLTSIELSSVTTIGDNFAYDCGNLTSIELSSVTTIGSYFAYDCSNLASIEFASDQPTLTGVIPYGTNYILDASAEGWTNFFGGRPVVFPSHTLETLEVNGTATGIAGVETNEFVIKLQMDAADALSPSYDGVTNIVALSDADPYLIVAADGTATVDRTKGYLQRIAMTGALVLDVGVSSATRDSQVSLTVVAGTNTLTYSVNATNTVYGLSDLSVTNTTMFELVSPYGQTEWQAFELETEFK